MKTESLVRGFITEELLHQPDAASFGPNDSLVSSGVLDSLALLKLLVFVEERFGVRIHDQDVVPANFDTVSQIVRFIELHAATSGQSDVPPAAEPR